MSPVSRKTGLFKSSSVSSPTIQILAVLPIKDVCVKNSLYKSKYKKHIHII